MRRIGPPALPVRVGVRTGVLTDNGAAVTLGYARVCSSYTATTQQQALRRQSGRQPRHSFSTTSALSRAEQSRDRNQHRDPATTTTTVPPLSDLNPNGQKKTAQDEDGPFWSPLDQSHSTVTQRIEAARRLRVDRGRLVAPTASYSDSDMFKHPDYAKKPKARRWDHILSPESLSRKPPVLKQAVQHLGKPGLVSLGGGIPTPSNFPLDKLTLRVPSGAVGTGFSEADVTTSSSSGSVEITVGKYDASSPPPASSLDSSASPTARQEQEHPKSTLRKDDDENNSSRNNNDRRIYDLSIAQNYSQSVGAAQLLRWVTEHTQIISDPGYADWRCALTIGSTGALEQALRMVCQGLIVDDGSGTRDGTGGRGDVILTEEFSFATALETTRPLGIGVCGVPMDEQGLLPEAMDEILMKWDDDAGNADRQLPGETRGRKPTVLYTVPSGQNPTGSTQGEQRRRDIYAVCRKHDVYIIEDEPYYYLQMPAYQGGQHGKDSSHDESVSGVGGENGGQDIDAFVTSLPPTYLSLDTEGRVMRLDSFSKNLIPGSRLGWVTASQQMIEQYLRHAECNSQGPSGLSQLIVQKLVDETWGHDGFLRWLMHLRTEYTARRDVLVSACERHLGRLRCGGNGEGGEERKRVVQWTVPRAGMFLWLEVNYTLHPEVSTKSLLEIEEEIYNKSIANGVLVCRGSWFSADPSKSPRGMFFRTTYAASSEENMVTGIERFGAAVRESFQLV